MINPCECKWAISSVVERLLYTQDAVGSNPTSPIRSIKINSFSRFSPSSGERLKLLLLMVVSFVRTKAKK
jgi:hypothetical protein